MDTKCNPSQMLLGAAFAGLAATTTQAATISEGLDFSNLRSTATDLIGSLPTGVNGTIGGGSGDILDAFGVMMAPGSSVSINYSLNATSGNYAFKVFDSSFADVVLTSFNNTGFQEGGIISGALDFTVPGDGYVGFEITHDTLTSTGYSLSNIDSIPEPGSAMLGIVGIAAAALRRRREQA